MGNFEMVLDSVKEAYIKVMGKDKWNAMTDAQKHDATMILVKGMLKALDKCRTLALAVLEESECDSQGDG